MLLQYFMMASTLIPTLKLLIGIVMVNGSSIKNCCNVAVKHHYFSINKNFSGVHNIIDLTSLTIVILSLMEEDGCLFKGEKMALRIFIDFGGSMRWDLAASQVSFGLV